MLIITNSWVLPGAHEQLNHNRVFNHKLYIIKNIPYKAVGNAVTTLFLESKLSLLLFFVIGGDMNIDDLGRCIDAVFDCSMDALHRLFRNPITLYSFANNMIQAGLISKDAQSEHTVKTIIEEFTAGIEFIPEQEKIEEHCIKFLSVLYTMKGSFALAADKIKNDLIKEVNKKLPGVQFKLDIIL